MRAIPDVVIAIIIYSEVPVQNRFRRQDPYSVTEIMVVRFPEARDSVICDEISVYRMNSWLHMIPAGLNRNNRSVLIRLE